MLLQTRIGNTMSKILVFTMQKVGSSSVIYALKDKYEIDRGYEENILELPPLASYEAIYTLVRDPVARNISWLFECHGNRILQENMRLEHIKQLFFDEIDQEYPLTWFDKVFFPVIGLDLYKYDFPANGVLLLGKVCVMRTDKMMFDHRADTTISRPYGAIYNNFLEWVKFPEDYLDEMYKSKYTQHFFLPFEIDELYQRWIDR